MIYSFKVNCKFYVNFSFFKLKDQFLAYFVSQLALTLELNTKLSM